MAAALLYKQRGGKSGLRRTGCWITSSPGDGKESATESIPPLFRHWPEVMVRVKW